MPAHPQHEPHQQRTDSDGCPIVKAQGWPQGLLPVRPLPFTKRAVEKAVANPRHVLPKRGARTGGVQQGQRPAGVGGGRIRLQLLQGDHLHPGPFQRGTPNRFVKAALLRCGVVIAPRRRCPLPSRGQHCPAALNEPDGGLCIPALRHQFPHQHHAIQPQPPLLINPLGHFLPEAIGLERHRIEVLCRALIVQPAQEGDLAHVIAARLSGGGQPRGCYHRVGVPGTDRTRANRQKLRVLVRAKDHLCPPMGHQVRLLPHLPALYLRPVPLGGALGEGDKVFRVAGRGKGVRLLPCAASPKGGTIQKKNQPETARRCCPNHPIVGVPLPYPRLRLYLIPPQLLAQPP